MVVYMSNETKSESNHSCSGGIGLGSVLAFIVSYCTWHSLGWGILHAIFGWAYLIYFAIVYTDILKRYLDHIFSLF